MASAPQTTVTVPPQQVLVNQPLDESLYAIQRWHRDQWRVRMVVLLMAAISVTLTLDHDRNIFVRSRNVLAVLFICRVVPASVLVICAFLAPLPFVARHWSRLSSFCLVLLALSVFLHQYFCSTNSMGEAPCSQLHNKQLLPWLPVVWIAVHPFVLACGLCASPYDVLWSGGVSMAFFAGLIIPAGTEDFIATAMVIAASSLVAAVLISYAQDKENKETFRLSNVSQRQTASLVERFAERAVKQEMHAKLADGIKRSGIMMSEVMLGGTICWVSPGCHKLLGIAPGALLHANTFRWIHAADHAAVQETLQKCMPVYPATPDGLRGNSADVHSPNGSCSLQFRRCRADGRGIVWVQAEVHPIINSVGGVKEPPPSVLIIEIDITEERERALEERRDVTNSSVVPSVVAMDIVSVPPAAAAVSVVPTSTVAAIAYDPLHERTLYTALACLHLSFASFVAEVDHVPSSFPFSEAQARVLASVESAAQSYVLALDDAIGIARLHSAILPLREDPVYIRDLVSVSAEFSKIRMARMGYSTSRLKTNIDDLVPLLISSDSVRIRTIVDLLLGVAIDVADFREDVTLAVIAGNSDGSMSASGRGGSGTFLRFALCLNAQRVGGIEELGAALSFDPLAQSGAFSPLGHGEVLPPSVSSADVSASALSYASLLPLLRHVTLCMGGEVGCGRSSVLESGYDMSFSRLSSCDTAAAAAAAQDSTSHSFTILTVDIPAALGGVQALVAGPTLPPLDSVQAAVAAAPFHVVQMALSPANSFAVPSDDSIPTYRAPIASESGTWFDGAVASVGGALGAGVGPLPSLVAAVPTAYRGTERHALLGLRVLFVDDDLSNRKCGYNYLSKLGCTCVLLEDGDEVMQQLRQPGPPFHAILMDIHMVRSDGGVICRDLRAAGVMLLIVAVTGAAIDTQSFFESGFDLVLQKPYTKQDILRVLIDGQAMLATRDLARLNELA